MLERMISRPKDEGKTNSSKVSSQGQQNQPVKHKGESWFWQTARRAAKPLQTLVLAASLALPSYVIPKQDLNKDYKSGAQKEYVSPSQLPEGVLGMYDPTTHTIQIANNLSSYQTQFVEAHESGHALGYGDEMATDGFAGAQVGYNLRPFGVGEDVFRTKYRQQMS
jgi:hypothetical protein